MTDWIARLFADKDLLRMGHCQRAEDFNLGMGWLYYGLVRLLGPPRVVVIGSWRGFTPLVFAKALADNVEGGQVWFIDLSLVDDFWKDGRAVREYFASFGLTNVRHFLMTTQQFVRSDAYRSLCDVGLAFIDGYHSEEQARFDFTALEPVMAPKGLILFHDSTDLSVTPISGPERAYPCRVKYFLDRLKHRPDLQVFDLPFGPGLTLVRKVAEAGTVPEPAADRRSACAIPSSPKP